MAGLVNRIASASRLFPTSPPPSIKALAALCSQKAAREQYPHATGLQKRIHVYELPPLKSLSADQHKALQSEWYRILVGGPGAFVTKGLYPDSSLLDRVTSIFHDIIQQERRSGVSQGDHFAATGKNDRIWNSFGKHAVADPDSFARYYSNPWLALICASWLGPGYRITAQANNVKPGGAAQVCHRDYHLGFMSQEQSRQFPQGVHFASQFLTLQGAVAHVDVPEESGPTRFLPFSQAFDAGYIAHHLPDFRDFFQENYVALPLAKGDGVFFNPALFHAAGTNESSDIGRMVNLLQVSSALGKPMEFVDTKKVVESTWGCLTDLYRERGLSQEVQALLAAVGEGYAFPTNLDTHKPRPGNMVPDSEQDVLLRGLEEGKKVDSVLHDLALLRP